MGIVNMCREFPFSLLLVMTSQSSGEALNRNPSPSFFLLFFPLSCVQSVAVGDMDQAQLEAFLTAQTRKHGGGGMTPEQAAALARFWKGHRVRVRESLLAQSRWEPALRGLSWRVDLQTATSRGQTSNNPVALVELELGRSGQVRGGGGHIEIKKRQFCLDACGGRTYH